MGATELKFDPNVAVVAKSKPYLLLGWRDDVARLLLDAKTLDYEGEKVLAVRHGYDETKLLRNLGLAVPSPLQTRYAWAGTTPYRAQRVTAELLSRSASAFVLSEFGTGKTLSALFAFDYLRQEKVVKKMLVVAPLSTLKDTWRREIARRMPHLKAVVLHGDSAVRRELFKLPADIYIINHDGVRSFEKEIAALGVDVVCVDELTAFKTAGAARTKAMMRIAHAAKFRWGMTGSPMAQGPQDAHGQVRVIAPSRVPVSAKRWRSMTMTQLSTFKWVPKRDATEKVFQAMRPAVRFARSEVVELPPVSIIRRDAEMSDEQLKAYKDIKNKLVAEFAEGKITAANEAVKMNKLLQISAGFMYLSHGGAVELDCESRVQAILSVMEESQAKFLLFSPFVAVVKMLHNRLAKEGIDAGLIYGDVTETARAGVFDRFRNDPACKGIVAHPRTMSHGLNLPEADMAIWASPESSLETYEQANARISRPGQTRKQIIVQIVGSPDEARVYKRLDSRATMQGALLELVRGDTE